MSRIVLAVTAAIALAACSQHAGPYHLGCNLRAGAAKDDVELAAVRGARAATTMEIAGRLQYSVDLSVLRVDPSLRVRVTLAIDGDTRHTSAREGDLRPVLSGAMHAPSPIPSFPVLHYECFPPVG